MPRVFKVNDPNKPSMTRDEFCDTLTSGHHKFRQIGNFTLLYEDDRDVITVALRGNVVIISSDGPLGSRGTIPSWQMKEVREGPDTYFWDGILQDVLALF